MRFKEHDYGRIAQDCVLNTFDMMKYQQARNKMFVDLDNTNRFALDLSTKPFENYYGQLTAGNTLNFFPIKNVPNSTIIFNREYDDSGRNLTLLKSTDRFVNVAGTYHDAKSLPKRAICNSSLGGNLPISRSNYKVKQNFNYSTRKHPNNRELYKNNDETTYGSSKKHEYASGENKFLEPKYKKMAEEHKEFQKYAKVLNNTKTKAAAKIQNSFKNYIEPRKEAAIKLQKIHRGNNGRKLARTEKEVKDVLNDMLAQL